MRAVSRPMPEVAPVIRMTFLPDSCMLPVLTRERVVCLSREKLVDKSSGSLRVLWRCNQMMAIVCELKALFV